MDSAMMTSMAMAMPTDIGSSDIFAATIFGCPLSSYIVLESACSVTDVPPCVTDQPDMNWDQGCCNSITSYGVSLASCYSQHAPACFDTSAAQASLTGQATESNPCAAYATGGAGVAAGAGSGSGSSHASTTGAASAGSTGASSAASSTSGAAAAATTTGSGGSSASGSGSGSGASAAASATKSAATKAGPALKVWLGVALAGCLAVLSL